MATQAQIAANRSNAQKSCGPTSTEGKKKSSLNAVSYGFAGAVKFIDGEDPEEFYGLQADLVHELGPATHVEQILVEKMVLNHWLSLRAVRLQSDALRFRMDSPTGETPKDLGLLIRYQTAADRAFHRAHTELLKAQKERKKSEIGFVSKNAEIAAQPPVETPPEPVADLPDPIPTPVEILEFAQKIAADLKIGAAAIARHAGSIQREPAPRPKLPACA